MVVAVVAAAAAVLTRPPSHSPKVVAPVSVVSVSPSVVVVVVVLNALGESSEQRESERAPVAVLARPA